jgi:hypothetical protein
VRRVFQHTILEIPHSSFQNLTSGSTFGGRVERCATGRSLEKTDRWGRATRTCRGRNLKSTNEQVLSQTLGRVCWGRWNWSEHQFPTFFRSFSIIFWKTGNGWAPATGRPLITNNGVPVRFNASPSSMSA